MHKTQTITVWLLALATALPVWGWAVPADGHDVRIGTRTGLTAGVRTQGTRVTVDGYLRDNLGQGIEGEIVKIDFTKAVNAEGLYARDVKTDRTGRYYISLRMPPGQYQGKLHYSGREFYYTPASLDLKPVETRKSTVELMIRAPKLAQRAAGSVKVAVAATSGAQPVPDLELVVQVGGQKFEFKTGSDGTAVFPLDLAEVPGAEARIVTRYMGSKEFDRAENMATMRILDGAALTLDVQPVRARLQRGVSVEGVFEDRHGGVAGPSVDIILSQAGEEKGRFRGATDADGRYSLFIDEDRYEAGLLETAAQVILPDGAVLEAPMVSRKVDKTGFTGLPWMLVSLLGAFGAILGGAAVRDWWKARSARKPKKKPRVTPKKARAPAIVTMDPSRAPSSVRASSGMDSLTGVLWDAQRDVALGAGQVAVLVGAKAPSAGAWPEAAPPEAVDAEGHFSIGPLPAGSYTLKASARGYVTATTRFTLPHRGDLSYFRLPLTPVRVVVRDIYADLADSFLAGSESAWGRLTPRQISQMLMEAVEETFNAPGLGEREGIERFRQRLVRVLEAERGEKPPLDREQLVQAFVSLLEEVYYSQRLHDEEVIAIAETLARRTRRRLLTEAA